MLRLRNLVLIPVGIALSGCADLKAEFGPARIRLPDQYSMLAPVTSPAPSDLEWWRGFHDPALDHLVARGLADNLSIAEARARLRESAADLRGAGVAVSGVATAEAIGNTVGRDRFDGSLDARINLANETGHRRDAAQARLNAALLNETEARRTVLSEIAQTYAELRFNQATREIRLADIRSRTRTVRDIETLLEAGEATRLDLLRAQSLLAETRSEIPRLEAAIVQQRNRLSTLLGRPVGLGDLDLGYAGSQPQPRTGTQIGVPADLLRARPDIRRAEELYAAALSDMTAANAARYPSLRLSGIISAPFGSGPTGETLLAGLVLPVFDQPVLAASVDAARARSEQAYLQWRIAVLDAVEEVENAQVLLRTALVAAQASREAVALDRESLDLSREMLAGAGNITVLDVLDRERALSASRTALARNLRDVASGYIALHVALGRGHPVMAETSRAEAATAAGPAGSEGTALVKAE